MSEQTVTPEQSTTTSTETKVEPTSTQPSVTSTDSKVEVKPEDKTIAPAAEKPTEEKPAAEAGKETSEAVQDEEYEIEVKEGSLLTQADLDELAETASDLGLSKDQAQKLVESREKVVASAIKAGEGKWDSRFQEDLKTMNSDPDFVGEKRAITDQHIARALNSFGDEKLIEYLNTPQGGSNINLAKFLVRIGQALAPVEENSDLTRQGGTTPAKAEPNQLERMYPSMFDKK